jgi:hypothetical protein
LQFVKNAIASQQDQVCLVGYLKSLDLGNRNYAVGVPSISFHFSHAVAKRPTYRKSSWQHTHRGHYSVSICVDDIYVLTLIYFSAGL